MRNVFKTINCVFNENWTGFWFMLDFRSVFARLLLDFRSTMLEIEQKIMLEKWFMLARFCSCSKALEAFSARARLGSKIISCDIARAQLSSKIFSLGSLELKKSTLVPNTVLMVISLFNDLLINIRLYYSDQRLYHSRCIYHLSNQILGSYRIHLRYKVGQRPKK